MEKLQINCRNNLLNTLMYFSSFEEQMQYKRSVPFVNITLELFQQWEGNFSSLKKNKWFIDIFSDSELKALNKFDQIVIKNERSIKAQGYRDIEYFQNSPESENLRVEAIICLEDFCISKEDL